MSKSSELDKQAKLYILSCISNEEDAPMSTQEKIDSLKETFKAEFEWRANQIGQQKAMAEYIAGLPTYFRESC